LATGWWSLVACRVDQGWERRREEPIQGRRLILGGAADPHRQDGGPVGEYRGVIGMIGGEILHYRWS